MLLIHFLLIATCNAFRLFPITHSITANRSIFMELEVSGSHYSHRQCVQLFSSGHNDKESTIDPSTLMDMDIVLYTTTSNDFFLGAIQEDSTLAPLSAWTLENAFNTEDDPVVEFVVDEEDRWNPDLDLWDKDKNLRIVDVLEEPYISYGSRQVGGGKGLGNPHGEESELVYYVDRTLLEERGVEIVLKPDLEILW